MGDAPHLKKIPGISGRCAASQKDPAYLREMRRISKRSPVSPGDAPHLKKIPRISGRCAASQKDPAHLREMRRISRRSNASPGDAPHLKKIPRLSGRCAASQKDPAHLREMRRISKRSQRIFGRCAASQKDPNASSGDAPHLKALEAAALVDLPDSIASPDLKCSSRCLNSARPRSPMLSRRAPGIELRAGPV